MKLHQISQGLSAALKRCDEMQNNVLNIDVFHRDQTSVGLSMDIL